MKKIEIGIQEKIDGNCQFHAYLLNIQPGAHTRSFFYICTMHMHYILLMVFLVKYQKVKLRYFKNDLAFFPFQATTIYYKALQALCAKSPIKSNKITGNKLFPPIGNFSPFAHETTIYMEIPGSPSTLNNLEITLLVCLSISDSRRNSEIMFQLTILTSVSKWTKRLVKFKN